MELSVLLIKPVQDWADKLGVLPLVPSEEGVGYEVRKLEQPGLLSVGKVRYVGYVVQVAPASSLTTEVGHPDARELGESPDGKDQQSSLWVTAEVLALQKLVKAGYQLLDRLTHGFVPRSILSLLYDCAEEVEAVLVGTRDHRRDGGQQLLPLRFLDVSPSPLTGPYRRRVKIDNAWRRKIFFGQTIHVVRQKKGDTLEDGGTGQDEMAIAASGLRSRLVKVEDAHSIAQRRRRSLRA